jgi:transcriptional regulator with XRE-family HTH domain
MTNDEATGLAESIGRTMERLRRHFPEQPCTQSYCAGRIGVKQQMWSKWESGQNIPSTEYQWRIADLFGITLDQLCGRDEFPVPAAPFAPRDRSAAPADPRTVPVIGLAACDVSGWFNTGPLAMRAPLPPDYPCAGSLFAVVAVGSSMVPDGIHAGFLIYCDSCVKPDPGDAVFVKTADGKATLKRFIQQDAEWVTLQGWLDPDKTGAQRPYTNQLAVSFIQTMATVIMVRRKA